MYSKLNLIVLITGQELSLRRDRHILSRGMDRLKNDKRGFGMNELLGIAAALIIAAFVIIPSLRKFAENVMTGLGTWWTNTIESQMFPKA